MTQTDPINWRLALLTQSPFLKTPPSRPEDAIWVGFPDLKKQLDTVFTEAFSSSRSQIILNRGEYGSGKTHAAIFCRRKDYLAQFQSPKLAQPSEIIYIRIPIEHEKAGIQLFQNIIEALHFRNIRALIKSTIIELGSQAALAKLQELAGSEVLGKALWLLGYQKTRSGRLTLFQDEDIIDNHHKLLERYFYSQNTKGELKRLDLSRSINSVRERFQLLSAIFQCFIGLDNMGDITRHRRIILWIDQMEDLIQYHPQYFHPLTQGLRDLIDRLPHYFILFMNFTAAQHRLVDDIQTGLGRELTQSITKQIYFREPDEDEAFEYVKDLMRQYRTEDFEQSGLSATYPFSEDALRLLIANLSVRTPYEINQHCACAIEEVLKQGVIHSAGEGTIDTQFVRNVEDQYLKFDMG
jgi:hypothetical protein